MINLEIRLFGTVVVSGHGGHEVRTLTRTLCGMLAFLVLHRDRPVPREVLMGEFWGDATEDHARNSLNTAVWRLRKALGSVSVGKVNCIVSQSSGEIGFVHDGGTWVDATEFESQIRLAQDVKRSTGDRRARLDRALQLYQADLLEGWYTDWALREREHFRAMYLNALGDLIVLHREAGDLQGAIVCACRILERDPLQEETYRELMRLHVRLGQRAEAIRRYEECRRLLHNELGLEPLEETQALYRSLKTAACTKRDDRGAAPRTGGAVAGRALLLLHQMRDQLARAIAELERGQTPRARK